MASYDPDEKPTLSEEVIREATKLGLYPIQVICEEPGAKVGDHTGVNFIACVSHTPRIGEIIELQDGTACLVRYVRYRTLTVHPGLTTFHTIVGAARK